MAPDFFGIVEFSEGNVNVSSENFRTFTVGKDKGFKFIGKSPVKVV